MIILLDIQMTVTWTSGYGLNEAEPFVEWGAKGGEQKRSPAGTLTFDRRSMCGAYNFPPKEFCLSITTLSLQINLILVSALPISSVCSQQKS